MASASSAFTSIVSNSKARLSARNYPPFPLANRPLKTEGAPPPASFPGLAAGGPACASSARAGKQPIKSKGTENHGAGSLGVLGAVVLLKLLSDYFTRIFV